MTLTEQLAAHARQSASRHPEEAKSIMKNAIKEELTKSSEEMNATVIAEAIDPKKYNIESDLTLEL